MTPPSRLAPLTSRTAVVPFRVALEAACTAQAQPCTSAAAVRSMPTSSGSRLGWALPALIGLPPCSLRLIWLPRPTHQSGIAAMRMAQCSEGWMAATEDSDTHGPGHSQTPLARTC